METSIIEMINSVGFPIAMCVALFWLVNNTLKTIHLILIELKTSIENNTKIINDLSNKIGGK